MKKIHPVTRRNMIMMSAMFYAITRRNWASFPTVEYRTRGRFRSKMSLAMSHKIREKADARMARRLERNKYYEFHYRNDGVSN